ncbi:MAG: amidohydrolase [Haliscomenobacteraceae bacterium CHB4]|nr:N-substituted formamide deformylase [Saprospiraceae bacterium]MCE7923319.1 amidohydrolase [Haliscomenobacteraceae bacterium CHB4]
MKFTTLIVLSLLAAITPIACTTNSPSNIPDLLLLNGNFFTADSLRPQATAVAVAGDRILAVGSDEEIKKLAGDKTEIIDLQGAFGMPGFIEGHGHFAGLGQSLLNLNLMTTRSWQEIAGLVAEKAETTAPGEWIEGRGWHQEKWTVSPGSTVNGYPYHFALDSAAPNNPVVLYHASGHGLIANTQAMQLAGISRETGDPIGGRIVRDAKGNAVGVFEENAMNLIEKPLLDWKNRRTEAEKIAAFEKIVQLASQECLAKGITSFQDAGSDFWEIGQYRRLAEASQLPLRLWVMISQPKSSELSKLAAFPQIGLGNGHLTVRAVKAYLDGALGSYGAWLLAPYADKPDSYGQNVTPTDSIAAVAAACKQYGLQCCVHAIGDRANREVLDIFEKTADGKPTTGNQLRWRIEHSQHIDPQDIPRFRQLGVIAAMQGIHCTSDAPFVVKRLGTERARTGAYAWRSLLDAGALIANGTDAPVEDVNPLPCLYATITRLRTDSGLEFFPEQKMTREEALLSYTLWNAWAAFEEKEKGSLTPGKYADVAILNKDLLRCAPEEILQAKVTKTIVGGKVLYNAK